MRRPPRTTCRQATAGRASQRAPVHQNYNSCLAPPIRIMVHDPARPPPMLRDTEGRACRKPRISRTKLAINRSGSETEKRGKEGSPNRAGRLTEAHLINEEEGRN